MTEIADPAPSSQPPRADRDRSPDAPAALHDLCPFLVAQDGSWRSARASRAHRCAALGADVPLPEEKQQRLCLAAAHRTCATFGVAVASTLGPASAGRSVPAPVARPYPRMVPVVLEGGRGGIAGSLRDRDRPGPQLILAVLMVVAFGAVVVARFSGVGAGPGLVAAGSPTPTAAVSTPPATPRPTPRPSASPSASPSDTPTQPPATATPTASTSGRTYTVQAGDTLSGIAARFGTTVRELVALNGIENPSRIRIGLELQLP
jgi:hypothetical protein